MDYFFHGKNNVSIFIENVPGDILGDFLTSSSGRFASVSLVGFRVTRFFLVKYTKTGGKMYSKNDLEITKCPYYVPNVPIFEQTGFDKIVLEPKVFRTNSFRTKSYLNKKFSNKQFSKKSYLNKKFSSFFEKKVFEQMFSSNKNPRRRGFASFAHRRRRQ
jgi:hypothetical protein